MANAARRYTPTFVATVTPSSVATRTGKNGRYVLLKDAEIAHKGNTMTRTVMAFGQSRDAVAKLLHKNRPVDLAVQFDGGTVRIVGLPNAEQQPANDQAPAPRPRRQRRETLLDACIAAGGFEEHRMRG